VLTASVIREELADYQLYALAERTSVASQQTKQIMFLSEGDVQFARILQYRMQGGYVREPGIAEPTAILLRTKNETDKGLGDPLPQGTARVFAPFADMGVLYAGEADTRDTAVGLEWELQTGESTDVTVRPRVVTETRRNLSGDRERVTQDLALEIANATDAPQTVEIVHENRGASERIRNPSVRYAMRKGAPTWTIVAPPNARMTLTYRASWIED
jgi:hypothetical protein